MHSVDPESLGSANKDELILIVKSLIEENLQLEKCIEELKRANARSATPFSKGKSKPKNQRKKSGRKGRKNGDKGEFKRREEPEPKENDQVERITAEFDQADQSLKNGVCPECGKALEIQIENASTIDTPTDPVRLIKIFEVPVARCTCGFCQRGEHPELAQGQHGATAHRTGPNIKAMGLALHYEFGVTLRKVPAILESLNGISISQSAITQCALKLGNEGGAIAELAEQNRQKIAGSDYVYTDDTGWKIDGTIAYLMGFGTKDTAYYQIRHHHRAKEVAEVINESFDGILITDRSPTYDAKRFADLDKQKCLSHILENLSKLEKKKKGPAKVFARKLKELLRRMFDLWHQQRDGTVTTDQYQKEGEKLTAELEKLLTDRQLKDPDNNSMLYELGRQEDEGNLTRFLQDPNIEPTNNFAERLLRPAVIARKVSQCSKNELGANAYAAFKGVFTTWKLRGINCIKGLAHAISSF